MGLNVEMVKLLAIGCLAALISMPVPSAAQDADARAALRSLPIEESASLVLTPQAAERLAPAPRIDGQLSLRSELETRTWSRSQSRALVWATTVACVAMGTSCSPMPPAPTPITPPGRESWQRVGCKTPDSCGWLWASPIPGVSVTAQQ